MPTPQSAGDVGSQQPTKPRAASPGLSSGWDDFCEADDDDWVGNFFKNPAGLTIDNQLDSCGNELEPDLMNRSRASSSTAIPTSKGSSSGDYLGGSISNGDNSRLHSLSDGSIEESRDSADYDSECYESDVTIDLNPAEFFNSEARKNSDQTLGSAPKKNYVQEGWADRQSYLEHHLGEGTQEGLQRRKEYELRSEKKRNKSKRPPTSQQWRQKYRGPPQQNGKWLICIEPQRDAYEDPDWSAEERAKHARITKNMAAKGLSVGKREWGTLPARYKYWWERTAPAVSGSSGDKWILVFDEGNNQEGATAQQSVLRTSRTTVEYRRREPSPASGTYPNTYPHYGVFS
ncbi:unnamed protein product [Diplocarpon coronariae]